MCTEGTKLLGPIMTGLAASEKMTAAIKAAKDASIAGGLNTVWIPLPTAHTAAELASCPEFMANINAQLKQQGLTLTPMPHKGAPEGVAGIWAPKDPNQPRVNGLGCIFASLGGHDIALGEGHFSTKHIIASIRPSFLAAEAFSLNDIKVYFRTDLIGQAFEQEKELLEAVDKEAAAFDLVRNNRPFPNLEKKISGIIGRRNKEDANYGCIFLEPLEPSPFPGNSLFEL